MSRIRSIHPGLTSDEAYMSMSMTAKAAWPLLWTECDDNGVFEWKPIVLKARIFPADAVDFAKVLAEYVALGSIQQFEMGGRTYGLVRNFGKYQRPKHPSYRHPLPGELRTFGGFKADDAGSAPPGLPPASPRPPEKPSQMKEEVGEEYTPSAQQLDASARAAPPDKLDRLLERLLEANGVAGFRAERHTGLISLAPILGLIEAGLDLDRDILPAIRSKPKPEARKWDYFVPQIREYVQRRQSAAAVVFTPTKPEDWAGRLKVWFEGGTWGAWGPRPGEAGCRVPAELLRENAA